MLLHVDRAKGQVRAALADFGLARLKDTSSMMHTSHQAGTAAYMAPEMFLTEAGDIDEETNPEDEGATALEKHPTFLASFGKRSDVYSFGACVRGGHYYELVIPHCRLHRPLLL